MSSVRASVLHLTTATVMAVLLLALLGIPATGAEAGGEPTELPPAIPAGTYTGTVDDDLIVAYAISDGDTRVTANEIELHVADDGSVRGTFEVAERGTSTPPDHDLVCPGGGSHWLARIDPGQVVGPALPQSLDATIEYSVYSAYLGNITPEGVEPFCIDPMLTTFDEPHVMVLAGYAEGTVTGAFEPWPLELTDRFHVPASGDAQRAIPDEVQDEAADDARPDSAADAVEAGSEPVGDHPDDQVIAAPVGALDSMAEPEPAADTPGDQPETRDDQASAPQPDAVDIATEDLPQEADRHPVDSYLSASRLLWAIMLDASLPARIHEQAFWQIQILKLLVVDPADDARRDGGDPPADPADPADPTTPSAEGVIEEDPTVEPFTEPGHWIGAFVNVLAASPQLTPEAYDGIARLAEGLGGSTVADDRDPTSLTRPSQPPPTMKPKHVKDGREWVSLDADHEVSRIVPKVNPKTKKRGWTKKGRITLKAGSWYQSKENRKKAIIFYDTTGRPIGVAGRDDKRGLQVEPWDSGRAEAP